MAIYLSGKHSVEDAIKSGLKIEKIYISSKVHFNIPSEIKVIALSKEDLDKMTRANHQGIIAEIKDVDYFDKSIILKDKPEKVLILDHIQDVHNFGAIIRSANAFGFKHIVIPKDRATKVTGAVMKVASGGLVNTKIIRVSSLNVFVSFLKENNYWIYASALENAKNAEEVTFNKPIALIVGNEQKGVSRPLLKLADEKVYIKMEGTVQSLNVSVASAILMNLIK